MKDTLSTPCFLLDEEEFKKGIVCFRQAIQNHINQFTIGYSVKTNSLPYALKLARKFGCKAEVVSDDELELARGCGFGWKDIVFNGPMKSKKRFLEAIVNGSTVNIETHREIEWLKDLPLKGCFKVGIRLNVNISEISPEDADGEDDFSRFGFCDRTDEFKKALEAIGRLPNVQLAGLHVHRTSHSRSVRFYENLCRFACETIKKYNLELEYLDLGGGYFGIFSNAPTFKDYAKGIHKALSEYGHEHLHIIVEPGNALTASAFSYYSTVIDVKELPGCRIVATDGSRNDVDPFFRKSRYLTEIARTDQDRPMVPRQIVTGATCLEYDQLFRLENEPELKVGDIIKYNNVGAYTLTLTPMFINYFPRVYAIDKNGLKLVRDKWTAEEMMQKSILTE